MIRFLVKFIFFLALILSLIEFFTPYKNFNIQEDKIQPKKLYFFSDLYDGINDLANFCVRTPKTCEIFNVFIFRFYENVCLIYKLFISKFIDVFKNI